MQTLGTPSQNALQPSTLATPEYAQAPPHHGPLQRLPIEILSMILQHLLVDKTWIIVHLERSKRRIRTDLLSICKLFFYAGSETLYRLNKFSIEFTQSPWLNSIGEVNVSQLRRLHLDFNGGYNVDRVPRHAKEWLDSLSMLSRHGQRLRELSFSFRKLWLNQKDFIVYVTLMDGITDLKTLKSLKSISITCYSPYTNQQIWLDFLNRKMGIPINQNALELDRANGLVYVIAGIIQEFENHHKEIPGKHLSHREFLATASLLELSVDYWGKPGDDKIFDYKSHWSSDVGIGQNRTFDDRRHMVELITPKRPTLYTKKYWSVQQQILEYLRSFWMELQELGVLVRKVAPPMPSGLKDLEDISVLDIWSDAEVTSENVSDEKSYNLRKHQKAST